MSGKKQDCTAVAQCMEDVKSWARENELVSSID